MTWYSPGAKELYTNTDDYLDLLATMKCPISGDAPNRMHFLNCVGIMGWEYVATEGTSARNMQLFRRMIP